ncbi:MAG: hypothetical protein Ta2G_20250 [Termitinemataceae bacterium]|nr:MAG: hypothetical protein Ta2G_20250 [Termitinemataceae bacterium]
MKTNLKTAKNEKTEIICCGIFKNEMMQILPLLPPSLDVNITFLESALHDNENNLNAALDMVVNEIAHNGAHNEKKIAFFYGSMCHPDMCGIACACGAQCFSQANCIDVFLRNEEKQKLENGQNVHFMTSGWIEFWKDIFCGRNNNGWDSTTARINLGVNDKIILLDSGCTKITDEDVLEIFDYIDLPVEIEKITLDYFLENVKKLLGMESTSA